MKKQNLPEEFIEIISPILEHPEFQRRKTYAHHGKVSVYEHCLAVSYVAYRFAKKVNADYRSAAIGGLLHDFYDSPWQENTQKKKFLNNMVLFMQAKLQKMHGNIFLIS